MAVTLAPLAAKAGISAGTKALLWMVGIWAASAEGRGWVRTVYSDPAQRKAASNIQLKMMEAEQEGASRATEASTKSYEKHMAMLLDMNQQALEERRTQRLTEMRQASQEGQTAMMMQAMSSLTNTPQISSPPTTGRMSLLRGGY